MKYEKFKVLRSLKSNKGRFRADDFKREWIPSLYKVGAWPSRKTQ